MIEALLLQGTATGQFGIGYRQPVPIYGRATVESRPLPNISAVGTGGIESEDYYRDRMGYQPLEIVLAAMQAEVAPFAKLMQEVKASFGRTMTRLPEVFGVSRQTLYNWLGGEMPKEVHQEKIRQLAAAARVFTELGFKPTSLSLDRVLSQGKSLLQLLSEGADGREMAKKLVRIAQRGTESKAKLDEILGDRKKRLDASDIGTPSLSESA